MKLIHTYFLKIVGVSVALLLLTFTAKSVNAPVTTIATVTTAVVNQQVTVPLTVTGFNSIAGLTLTLDYEYAKLHYVSGTYNPALTGYCSIGEIDLGNGKRRLTISWAGGVGVNLADGSWLVKYVFTFLSGPAPLTFFDNGPACVFNDPSYNTLTDVPYASYYINGSVSQSTKVNAKVLLEGPYSSLSATMNTSLKSAGLLPLTQPYSAAPWNYSGTESVASIPANVVDWVLVELRTGIASSTKVASRAGFLLNSGLITDLDGSSTLGFNTVASGNYYLVVKHRNHMPAMSSVPVALSGSSVIYDFSTSASQYYGGASGCKLIDAGLTKWGLISGDPSNEGSIYINDYTDYWITSFGLTNVYNAGDFKLDGSVLIDDYTDYWVPNFGKINTLP